MTPPDLRIALFSGNYNYVRDGANQALNRLVDYLLRRGAAVRTYAPTVREPAFAPTGTLVSLPSIRVPIKGRGEYRVPLGVLGKARTDLKRFAPNIVHVSSPDPAGHGALAWARKTGVPVLASVHTRFETYPRYYGMEWLERPMTAALRRYYKRCDALVAPSASMIAELREQGMGEDIGLWTRGVDRAVFDPARRDLAWRRALAIADDEVAIAFLGRLVMEKGLGVFAQTIRRLRDTGAPFRVIVIGDGPARGWFEDALGPQAVFAGFQTGPALGRALASADLFFNPSITETFGNVTLEAMASGLPVVAARATGSASLVADGATGRLADPEPAAFAEAIAPYLHDPALRRAHGRAGERRAQDYEWDAVNDAVLQTYLRLAARAR